MIVETFICDECKREADKLYQVRHIKKPLVERFNAINFAHPDYSYDQWVTRSEPPHLCITCFKAYVVLMTEEPPK